MVQFTADDLRLMQGLARKVHALRPEWLDEANRSAEFEPVGTHRVKYSLHAPVKIGMIRTD